MDNTKETINILLEAGFVETASVLNPGGAIHRIAGNRFVATSTSIRRKFKYPHGNMRVTVGSRTVCFYRVHKKKAFDFVRYKAAELDKIKSMVNEIKNRY